MKLKFLSIGRNKRRDAESQNKHSPPALFVLPCLSLVLAGFLLFPSAGRDDIHITLWPAHTLAQYGKIANVNGDPIEQCSSLLHLVLLAGLAKITPIGMLSLAKLSSIAFALATLLVIYQYIMKITNGAAGFAAAMITGTSVYYVYWSFGGLETTLVSFISILLIISIAGYLNNQGRRTLLWPTTTMLLYELVRPETPILLGCILISMMGILVMKDFSAKRKIAIHKLFISRTCILLLIWAIVSVTVFAFRWWHFGKLLPQPAIAKFGGFSKASLMSGILYIGKSILSNCLTILPLALSITAGAIVLFKAQIKARQLDPYIVLSILYVMGNIFFIAFSGGDWMEGGRFFVHFLPIAITFIPLAWAGMTNRIRALVALTMMLVGVSAISLFLFARQNSTGFPIWSRVHIKSSYNRSDFSWFEMHNRIHIRDIPVAEYLNQVVARLIQCKRKPIVIMSAQMGMVPFHVNLKHYREVQFIDRFGIIEDTFTKCKVTKGLPKKSHGLQLSYEYYFKMLAEIKQECGFAEPDIIFDLGSAANYKIADHNYTVIYSQDGKVMSGETLFKGMDVPADEFIAVRSDLVSFLGGMRPISFQFDR